MINIYEIENINDVTIFTYENLSDESKKNALKEVVAEDLKYFKLKCLAYYHPEKVKDMDINKIPDAKHILKHNNVEYMEKYIEGNFLSFLEDGTYVSYSKR